MIRRYFFYANNDELLHQIASAAVPGKARMFCDLVVRHGEGRAFLPDAAIPPAYKCHLCMVRSGLRFREGKLYANRV